MNAMLDQQEDSGREAHGFGLRKVSHFHASFLLNIEIAIQGKLPWCGELWCAVV